MMGDDGDTFDAMFQSIDADGVSSGKTSIRRHRPLRSLAVKRGGNVFLMMHRRMTYSSMTCAHEPRMRA